VRFELPQAFFMLVAMGLALREIDREVKAIEFYNLLSSFAFMASTPTLFNAGTLRPQLSGLGAHIKGTNGQSQGIVPFLKVANDTAIAVNQGGKRKGAVCAYLVGGELETLAGPEFWDYVVVVGVQPLEPLVSDASAPKHRPAATAAPGPLEEMPGK
jgi:ribonucleotide reductase alpha subunit